MLVCRLWRAVAISSPSLWTFINLSWDGRLVEAFLRRSGALPLTIYSYGCTIPPWLPEVAARHSFRFQHIEIDEQVYDVDSSILAHPILEALSFPAPLLETLKILIYAPGYFSDEPQGMISLPPLFADVTPKLRTLELSHYTCWPGNHFTGIIKFSFGPPSDAGHLLTSQLFEFLESNPTLQCLEFSQIQLMRNVTDRIITLPNLQTLGIYDFQPEDALYLLSLLGLPASVVVTCTYPRLHNADHERGLVFPHNIPLVHIRDSDVLAIAGSVAIHSFKVFAVCADANVSWFVEHYVRTDHVFDTPSFHRIIGAHSFSQSLRGVTRLSITFSRDFDFVGLSSSVWAAALDCFPKLSILTVEFGRLTDIVAALQPTPTDPDIRCPHLSRLHLSNVLDDDFTRFLDLVEFLRKYGRPAVQGIEVQVQDRTPPGLEIASLRKHFDFVQVSRGDSSVTITRWGAKNRE